jgi:hypothetical protein
MRAGRRTEKAAGTYGLIGVLRNPLLLFKPPEPKQSQGDLQAVRRGEARKVSCFLRGSLAPYPRRLRQGTLYLSGLNVHWEPFWSVRRIPQQITGPFLSITTRPADDREPNVKKGGGSILNVPSFTVVTCHTPHGAVDLVVPEADARLVASCFEPTSTGDRTRGTN